MYLKAIQQGQVAPLLPVHMMELQACQPAKQAANERQQAGPRPAPAVPINAHAQPLQAQRRPARRPRRLQRCGEAQWRADDVILKSSLEGGEVVLYGGGVEAGEGGQVGQQLVQPKQAEARSL